MMLSFVNITYLFSLLSAILTLITAAFVSIFHYHHLRVIPRDLRIYFLLCFFPYLFITPFSTSLMAFFTLFELQNYSFLEVLTFVSAFSTQMIRSSFFMFIIERIFASIYWKTYKLSNKISAVLCLISYGTTIIYISILFYTKYNRATYILFNQAIRYYIFFIHFVTLFICTILYYFNKKMYKITAYRITLKFRYQILENVKILSYMFPAILIYTAISPLGSLVSLIFSFWFKSISLSSSFLHICYNLPLLLICLRHIYIKPQKDDANGNAAVKNVFGKTLPTMFPTDNYFQGLKQQWK